MKITPNTKTQTKFTINSLTFDKKQDLLLYNEIDTKERKNKIIINNIKFIKDSNIKSKEEEDDKMLQVSNEKNENEICDYRKKLYEEHHKLLETKKIKEEKEKKDIKELYDKWKNETIVSTKEKTIREFRFSESKNRQNLFDSTDKKKNEELRKSTLDTHKIFNKMRTINGPQLFYDTQVNEGRFNTFFGIENDKQKQVEIINMPELINRIKMRNSDMKDLKKIEKKLSLEEKLDIRYDRIKPKGKLFLKGEMKDLVEKLEFVYDIEKYISKEIDLNFEKKHPNLLSPADAVSYHKSYIINILGYFASELCLNNIDIYVEKKASNVLIRDIAFKIVTSGLATQRVYKLTIQSHKKKSSFRNNIEQWIDLNCLIKDRIVKSFNISRNDIYFFNYNLEKMEVSLIIYNKKISGLPAMLKHFGVKSIVKPLLSYIILSSNIFEKKYCKGPDDWPEDKLRRGKKKYFPPDEYYGLALKVKEKYKKYGKEWLGKTGDKDGEWPVAYHGVGKGKVFKKILNILDDNLKEGPGQLYKTCRTKINKNEFDFCKEGVYLAPDIEEAEKYADKVMLGWFRKKFQFVIMTRVNPKKIRDPGKFPVNWILNGNDEEIRPYRLLIKIT